MAVKKLIEPVDAGYQSPYSVAIQGLINKVTNREAFSYDQNLDPAYQSLAKTYGTLGDRARQDTMADVAGNTGGMVSSWAVSAGQMAQNDYNQKLVGQIPALMEAAYNRYTNEFNMNNSALGQLMDLDNTGYNRYADNRNYARNIYESDRGYDRGVYESDRSYNYQTSRDKVTDNQWLKEYLLSKARLQGNSGSGGGSGSGSTGGNESSGGTTTGNYSLPADYKPSLAVQGYTRGLETMIRQGKSDSAVKAIKEWNASGSLTDNDVIYLMKLYGLK